MIEPLGVSPSKGNQGTTRGRGFDSHRGQKKFFLASCGSLIPFTRANAQWVSWVSQSTLIYTSELILCSHICVYSATRHNIHVKYSAGRLIFTNPLYG